MTNTEIIYKGLKNLGLLPELDLIASCSQCKICGKWIGEGVPYQKVVSGSFTNWDLCRAKDSNNICRECASAIRTKELRSSSFIADSEQLIFLKKADLEEYLLNIENYVKGEFVVCLTRSYKKHSSFKAPVNLNTEKYFIQEEDKTYRMDLSVVKPLYKTLWDAYLWFTKDELLTGQYHIPALYADILEQLGEWEELFRKHRGTHYYNLLVYMLDSEKRNEIVKERIKEQKIKKGQK